MIKRNKAYNNASRRGTAGSFRIELSFEGCPHVIAGRACRDLFGERGQSEQRHK